MRRKTDLEVEVISSLATIKSKVRCVFTMIVVSLLPRGESGPNDYREDIPLFIARVIATKDFSRPQGGVYENLFFSYIVGV